MPISWEENTRIKFDQMILKIPTPMQEFAKGMLIKKVQQIISKAGRDEITEKDMVDAFFEATPFGFHGPMKTDMESLGIDYIKYGYQR